MNNSNEGKARRDAGIALVVGNAKEEYRAHYRQTMAQFFATIRVGGTFRIEEGHDMLKLAPHVAQATSGLSSGFIRPKLDDGSVVDVDTTTSSRRKNNATRTRVYRRVR